MLVLGVNALGFENAIKLLSVYLYVSHEKNRNVTYKIELKTVLK